MDPRIVQARRSVAEALRLDGEQLLKDAYQQYLLSLITMYQMLLEDSQKCNGFRDLKVKETSRVLRMACQCTDRVSELISEVASSNGSDTAGQPPGESQPQQPQRPSTQQQEQPQPLPDYHYHHQQQQQPQPPPTHPPSYWASTGCQSPDHTVSPPTNASIPTVNLPPPSNQGNPPTTQSLADSRGRAASATDATLPDSRMGQLAEHFQGATNFSKSVPVPATASLAAGAPTLNRHASANASLSPTPTPSDPHACGQTMKQLSFVEKAQQRNQQLMTTYQARMDRLHGLSPAAKSQMTMSMMRQLQENIAIAKSRDDVVKQKMQERQLRIAKEHRRRLEEAQDPLDHKQLCLAVDKFEKTLVWVKERREKIAQNPDDGECISSFVSKVLSTPEHPLAKKLGVYQYRVYHTLLPLARHAAPTTTAAMSSSATSSSSGGISALHTAEGGRLAPPPAYDELSNPEEPSSSQQLAQGPRPTRPPVLSSDTFEPSQDDPEDDETLATVLDILGMQKSSDAPGAASADDASNLELEPPEADLEQTRSPSPGRVTQLGIVQFGTSLCSDGELELAEVCSLALKDIVKDIHNAIDLLEVALLVVYGELRTATGRDQCRVAIETSLFPSIWALLLDIMRMANIRKEKVFTAGLNASHSKSLAEMGVPPNFRLGFNEQQQQPQGQPYQAAIRELCRITTLSVPLEKLECVVEVSRRICTAVEEYFVSIGKSRHEASPGCDDLLPILSYCIVSAGVPQLASECAAMEEFIHEAYLMGEEGYCLTTLQTALSHVSSLGISH